VRLAVSRCTMFKESLLSATVVPSDAVTISAEGKVAVVDIAVSRKPTDRRKPGRIATERLRAILILFVVFFHVGVCYQVSNGTSLVVPSSLTEGFQSSPWALVNIILGNSAWPMVLFVTIAGYACYFSVRSRGLKEFYKERSARLLIPFVFGTLVLNSFAVALIFQYSASEYSHTFIGFYSTIYLWFQRCFNNETDYCLPEFGLFDMWFLLEVFFFCAVSAPFHLRLSRRAPPSWSSRKATVVAVLTFALALPLLMVATDSVWLSIPLVPEVMSSNNAFFYFFMFQIGAILAWSPALHEAFAQIRWYSLAVSVVTLYAVCSTYFATASNFYSLSPFWQLLLFDVFRLSTAYWVWGFAISNLNAVPSFMARWMDYLAPKVICIYVLHFVIQVCVLYVMYYTVRPWFLRDSFLYALIDFFLTLAVCLGLYETIFCRPYLRALVGMWKL